MAHAKHDRQAPTTVSEALQGVWRSRGYGHLLDIGPQRYTLYEETAVSCLPVFEGTLAELDEYYVDVSVSPKQMAFTARLATGVTRVRFGRLSQAPPPRGEDRSDDPLFLFDLLWHTFEEHYALFDLREIDWSAARHHHRPRIGPRTSPSKLFEVVCDMLRPLRDGHVQLRSRNRHFNAGAPPPLYERLREELRDSDDSRDAVSYFFELRDSLRHSITQDYLRGPSRSAGNNNLEWGQLDDQTGYLAIRAMAGLSDRTRRPRKDMAVVDRTMQRVLGELGHLPRLVIDLRGNGGGFDGVALRMAGYFTDRKRLAFRKAARRGPGFTGQQPVYLRPEGPARYRGHLVILTSGLTASAAEIFVLALMQRPNLVRIGEPTQGILSDAMERQLPNGWQLTLSNELYQAFDGTLYEDCGIPPHIAMPWLDPEGRRNGRDTMLDRALSLARG